MDWATWVGVRYLYSKKNTKFLSFITMLALVGIALGVASMIVVLSVMSGFESELKKRLFKGQPHIIVEPTVATQGYRHGFMTADLLLSSDIQKIISSRVEIEHVIGIVQTEAILKVYQKVAGVILKGLPVEELDRKKDILIESIDSTLWHESGFRREDQIYIGEHLALELSLIPGDVLEFISPLEFDGPMGVAPIVKKAIIGGVYRSGSAEQELHYIFCHTEWVWAFLKQKNILSQLEFVLHNPELSEKVMRDLNASIAFRDNAFRMMDWKQMNAQLFASLQLERMGMFMALGLIILVASFNILTVLILMILEKKKEIAILLTLGGQRYQVAKIFLTQGFLIGIVGLLFGVSSAYLTCVLLTSTSWFELPDIYYDKNLPVAFEWKYYVMVALFTIVIVWFASLYPARRAVLGPINKNLRS